ncbi:MAG: S-layer homology domain-containing protein [Syntrophomonadaceae bacterium]|nr:S-layer homology domain-containing protein [Syntrophomonadaceae bacterium]
MKKLIGLLMVAMLLMTPSASATILDDTNTSWTTGIHTYGINNDPYDQAEMLKQLGLFGGTEKGVELERNMTRAEAAVMLVRFMGTEGQVRAGIWHHPFKDVPQWANKYIGWLYQNGLTSGMSKTRYGAKQNINLEQYAVFLSRAVCGNDNWQSNGIATADEVKLWDKDNRFFTRAAAIGMSTRALTLPCTRNSNTCTMARYLVDHGVFTPQQLLQAAWGVLLPEYRYLDNEGYIYSTIAGVTVGKTDIGGLRNMTGTDSSMPYFFACATQGQNTVLYQIDCKTMKSTAVSSKALPGGSKWSYMYASTINEKDYLFEYAANTLNLVLRDDDRLSTVLPDFKFYRASVHPNLNYNYFVVHDALLVAGSKQYYLSDKTGISAHTYVDGTQVLGFDGTSIVTQQVTKYNTTISCLCATDGTTLDSYRVKQDMPEDYNSRTVKAHGNRYYGEAGLYVLDSKRGRLEQITARPTLDITTFRMDYRNIILTHDPGQRIHGVKENSGEQVIIIEYDGSEHVILSNDPPHGISIEGFKNEAHGDAVAFYSAADAGNIYYYVLLPSFDASTGTYDEKQPQIIVTGYSTGHPEVETAGYEQTYIQKEQARLNLLGYGYKD